MLLPRPSLRKLTTGRPIPAIKSSPSIIKIDMCHDLFFAVSRSFKVDRRRWVDNNNDNNNNNTRNFWKAHLDSRPGVS